MVSVNGGAKYEGQQCTEPPGSEALDTGRSEHDRFVEVVRICLQFVAILHTLFI